MNINQVIYAGRLTRDPQQTYLPSKTAKTEFGIATSKKFKKQDGEYGEEKCFVDCIAFGKLAENITKFFKKGDGIFINGRLKLEQWETTDGQKKSKLRILVESFEFVGGKKERASDKGEQEETKPNYENSDIPF